MLEMTLSVQVGKRIKSNKLINPNKIIRLMASDQFFISDKSCFLNNIKGSINIVKIQNKYSEKGIGPKPLKSSWP